MNYSFNSRVRYSETGEDGRLTLPGVLNYKINDASEANIPKTTADKIYVIVTSCLSIYSAHDDQLS